MRISEFLKKLNEITKEKNDRFAFQIENLQAYTYRFTNIDEAWKHVNFFNNVGFGFINDKQTTIFIKKYIDQKQNVIVINNIEYNILKTYENAINTHIKQLRMFFGWIKLPQVSDKSFSLTVLHKDNIILVSDLLTILNWVSRIDNFFKNAYQKNKQLINISSCEYGSFNLDFNIVDIAQIVIWIISLFFFIRNKMKKKTNDTDTDDSNKPNKIDNDTLLENEYLKKKMEENQIKNDFNLERAKIDTIAEDLFNGNNNPPKAYCNINEFKNALWKEYEEFKKQKIYDLCNFKLTLNTNENKLIEYKNNKIDKIETNEIKKILVNNQENNDDEKKTNH